MDRKEVCNSFSYDELLDFIVKNSKMKHDEIISFFIDEVNEAADTIRKLYEKYKMYLFIEGVTVCISVESPKDKAFEIKIGPTKAETEKAIAALYKVYGV